MKNEINVHPFAYFVVIQGNLSMEPKLKNASPSYYIALSANVDTYSLDGLVRRY